MTNGNGSYREILEEKIRQGLLDHGYVLGDKLSVSRPGPSGSTVFRGEKEGEPVALKLASYSFLDSFEDPAVEKLDDFRRRERETLQQAGSHPNIPDYRESFTIPGDERSEPIHVLAMQYVDMPSIAKRIINGERVSDEESKILLKDGTSALGHLHTGLPTQTLHRDVKTTNILVGGHDVYVIDFDIVKQGEGSSTRVTQLEANGYYPEDFYRGMEDTQKPEHDIVALGNVAIAGIAGKEIGPVRYEQGKYGLEPVNTDRLNVSPEIRKYLAKMTALPGERFQTAQEALEGLERVLGNSVQLVQPRQTHEPEIERREEPDRNLKPKPQEQETREEGTEVQQRERSLPSRYSIKETEDCVTVSWETASRGEYFLNVEKGVDIYETAKRVREDVLGCLGGLPNQIMHLNLSGGSVESVNREANKATFVYLQHAAQKHPDLKRVLDEEETTLPELYEEVKKGKPSFLGFLGDSLTASVVSWLDTSEVISNYNQSKEAHKQRVGELEKVVSGAKQALGGIKENGDGFIFGGTGGLALIFYNLSTHNILNHGLEEPLILLSMPIGAKLGSNVQRGFKRRKLKKKLREMDSWLQKSESSGDLEKKAKEGDVSLSKEEKRHIVERARNYSLRSWAPVALGSAGAAIYYAFDGDPINNLYWVSLGGLISSLPLFFGFKSLFNKHLKNRALKQKRLAKGLPANEPKKEMREFDHFEAQPKDYSLFRKTKLKSSLSKLGLRRKTLRRKLVNKGVEVSYRTNVYEGNYGSTPCAVEIEIRATENLDDQKKAMEVYQTVERDFNIFDPPTITEDGRRRANHFDGNHEHPKIKILDF